MDREGREFVCTIRWKATYLFVLSLIFMGCTSQGSPVRSPAPESAAQALQGERGIPDDLPVIDGSIHDSEWENAQTWDLKGGGELFLLAAGEDLYLALRVLPPAMIAGNVFLYSGDEIRVLHSSAALGTAVFQQVGEKWQKVEDFQWCCRARVDDQNSRDARQAFFERDGWLGANSFLGSENELEYRIRLEGLETALAVNYLWADGSAAKEVWPAGLADGVSWPSQGGFPDELEFTPGEWHPISLSR
jgi:prepilin-type processing-associated H-X9-DG protein